MAKIVGQVNKRVIELLNLDMEAGTKIFLGPSNISHMKSRHPEDYKKYGADIAQILRNPDYVGWHKSGSLEYVKEYVINNEYVKVAVRVSGQGKLFARSLYVLNHKRVDSFIAKGDLKKY